MTLAQKINNYLKVSLTYKKDPSLNHYVSLWGDLEEVSKTPSKNLIKRCVCNRKRHQQLLSNVAVKTAVSKINTAGILSRKYTNFEELYDDLLKLIGTGKTGISNCTVYDCALRVGSIMSPKVEPKEYVYYHRHLCKNVRHIFGISHLPHPYRMKYADFVKLEPAFKKLTPIEVEDFLCLM
ncbi:MAG: hypothetical protein K5778_01610 [Bacteroidaceae bacterium]|nr:hypothetical protein [Bacteroidaceae bacterium]